MNLKDINIVLNIILKYKLNNIETNVLQDAILLSQSSNEFVLNRYHLRFKLGKGEELTRQQISRAILSLEDKNVLEQTEKYENQIQHKFCEGVFNV